MCLSELIIFRLYPHGLNTEHFIEVFRRLLMRITKIAKADNMKLICLFNWFAMYKKKIHGGYLPNTRNSLDWGHKLLQTGDSVCLIIGIYDLVIHCNVNVVVCYVCEEECQYLVMFSPWEPKTEQNKFYLHELYSLISVNSEVIMLERKSFWNVYSFLSFWLIGKFCSLRKNIYTGNNLDFRNCIAVSK